MNWITVIASLTPLLIALGVGIRWLGKQIWQINVFLATQNEAIRWQNNYFDELRKFDSSVDVELSIMARRLADIERYLEAQTPHIERPFVIRARSRQDRAL